MSKSKDKVHSMNIHRIAEIIADSTNIHDFENIEIKQSNGLIKKVGKVIVQYVTILILYFL